MHSRKIRSNTRTSARKRRALRGRGKTDIEAVQVREFGCCANATDTVRAGDNAGPLAAITVIAPEFVSVIIRDEVEKLTMMAVVLADDEWG